AAEERQSLWQACPRCRDQRSSRGVKHAPPAEGSGNSSFALVADESLPSRNDAVQAGERDRLGRSSRRPADWFWVRGKRSQIVRSPLECFRRDAENCERDAGGTPALLISTEYSQLGNWNSGARKPDLETGNRKLDTPFCVNIELINTG